MSALGGQCEPAVAHRYQPADSKTGTRTDDPDRRSSDRAAAAGRVAVIGFEMGYRRSNRREIVDHE